MAPHYYPDFGVDNVSYPLPSLQNTDHTHNMAPVPSSGLQPNGAAPPIGGTTGAASMESKKHLRLTHLPARKDIKAPFPRTPGSVCIILDYIYTHIG